jgi:hypothetical protein
LYPPKWQSPPKICWPAWQDPLLVWVRLGYVLVLSSSPPVYQSIVSKRVRGDIHLILSLPSWALWLLLLIFFERHLIPSIYFRYRMILRWGLQVSVSRMEKKTCAYPRHPYHIACWAFPILFELGTGLVPARVIIYVPVISSIHITCYT